MSSDEISGEQAPEPLVVSGGAVWREGLLERIGKVYAALFLGAITFSFVLGRPTALLWFGMILGATYLLLLTLNKRGVAYHVRAWTLVTSSVLATVAFYLFAGLNPGPVLAAAFCLTLSALLLGRMALLGVLSFLALFLLTITATTWLGLWTGPVPAVAGSPAPQIWLTTTLVSTMFWAGCGFSVLYITGALERTVEDLRDKEKQRREADDARREAEAIARQSQKLEALGQLSAGVAHDFNNALLVLRGWHEILKEGNSPDMEDQAHAAIAQALDQSEQLASQLLTFGRKQIRSPVHFAFHELVEQAMKTLSRVVPSNIQVHLEIQGTGSVFADEGQAQQLLFNLVLNAADALPEGGDIYVRCFDAQADSIPAFKSSGLEQCVVLEVEDNGIGMDEETRQRVFEPFFTTKTVGKGTGLGLATVFGIVQQSNAQIHVWSEPGKGARFAIAFPRFDGIAEPIPDVSTDTPVASATGRVLVLEDDPLASDLLVFALSRGGFEVLLAGNGDRALEIIGAQDEPIDLISADAVFPGATLNRVLDAYTQANPAGQILICSGYVPTDAIQAGIESGRYEFLPKPFSSDQLVNKLASMLG